MTLTARHLLGLPVVTQSGKPLGKVHDFTLDSLQQSVTQYTVRNTNVLRGLFGHELLIAASQVISLTSEKMVVEDLVVREGEPAALPETPVTGV